MKEKLPESANKEFTKKMLKVLGLTTAYPSTILIVAWIFHLLTEKKILSKLTAAIIFFLIIFTLLIQIVRSAIFKKSKSKNLSN